MRSFIVCCALLVAVQTPAENIGGLEFEDHFVDQTLRVDFVQFGDAADEAIGIDRLIRQGVWAGPTTRLTGGTQYGRYAVRLVVPETGTVLFEKAFDSYFGEYRTTEAAQQGQPRAYHNTVLVPFPKDPVELVFESRTPGGAGEVLSTTTVQPDSVDIATEPPTPGVVVVAVAGAKDPHHTLDIAIVGEGYRADETDRFRDDFARFSQLLLEQEPYASYANRIAVRGVLLPSADSGADEPTHGLYRTTSVGMTFNSLGSERYMLTEHNRALRDIAANVPYDTLIIMVNHERYGGGGIYNSYCSFTAHGPWSEYLLLHEFGHSFAGLADEYYTSDVAYSDFYPPGVEPAEPNITALGDPEALKWGDLVDSGTPLPTPWSKEEFDRISQESQAKRQELSTALAEATRSGAPDDEIEALEHKQQQLAEETAKWTDAFLAKTPFADSVGAFEGAGYASQGLFRPEVDCLMFRRGVQPFCRVCERAVAKVIRHFID
jgi:hypothetical protein